MRRSLIRASRYRNIVYLIVLNNQTSGACNEAGIKMSELERGGHDVSKSLSLVPRHVLRSVCFYFSSLRRLRADAECVFEFLLQEMNTFVHLHWPARPRDAIRLACVRVISFPFQMFLMFK